ncbi:endonuclease/exonuclease/phosphatase family protein [Vibrio ostreicida]|uniref:Endonuclease/exonuclease/phosphatase family protein n=2 Tax=Vibrio ostreicida TaxID=526588 RepID=A0ABT8BT44_9VIBR|nr:endonuclease/exonuclease/phosphatase family protein [Vibrio ostreicida]MDN3609263.1 endonuclease/exonuclease/phosphatase family protein [Vibrio ostreicida]NPD08154.1 endonuclease/exonuclease/phosphatase family protein [Vibrio ostreicida]
MKFRILLFPIALVAIMVTAFETIFTRPESAPIVSISAHAQSSSFTCIHHDDALSIDKERQINLLVWNLYKQKKPHWQQSLGQYSMDKQLVLLQEASMTPEFKHWVIQRPWFANQVEAFKVFDVSTGVLNLAAHRPALACAFTELEPWLGLPKSALYEQYPLSNGQSLAVVNIHSVNFTFGIKEYQTQLDTLAAQLARHAGPMIVAGDFNSWSEERFDVLTRVVQKLGLKEVEYRPDRRTRFLTGLPLDHVFFRGLTLKKAETSLSDASDHNPIEVTFELTKQDIKRPNQVAGKPRQRGDHQ